LWLVVGLGNPGKRYQSTRHNMGFAVIDRLTTRMCAGEAIRRCGAAVAEARHEAARLLLVKPLTYMNESGAAVAELKRVHRLPLTQLVLVHDDVDLEPGRVRLRVGGGSGGHLGVASVIDTVGSPDFLRVKVGVGRPVNGVKVGDFVLNTIEAGEKALLDAGCDRASDAVTLTITEGPQRAMNRINQRETAHGGSPL
jgi:PTH1 family peptidyl-tRNA hydrolase